MPYSLIHTDDDDPKSDDKPIYGVAVAEVVSNRDMDRKGQVQVRFPWYPDIEPWARVAAPVAGDKRGVFFIPQEGDEVLVAFNHGDIREPYIVGSLWNGKDDPPATEVDDPVNKGMIRTPGGHELTFDDKEKTIVIKSLTRHRITIGKDKVVIADARDGAKDDDPPDHVITIDGNGIKLEAKKGDITLEAPKGKVSLKAQRIEISGSGQTELKADGDCVVSGKMVRIN